MTNDDLTKELDTSDEWITSRTGVRQRFTVPVGMATSDLAVVAAQRALSSSGMTTVEAVVLATSTPDHPCPATAPDVATRLGLAQVAAFDVAAVCAGFVYALATAAGLIESRVVNSALVIGADTFSTILHPQDRTTRVIFGDGAGAVVLRAGNAAIDGALLAFDLGSDGTGRDLITVWGGGARQRSSRIVPAAADLHFAMQGKAVFNRAVQCMGTSVAATVRSVGWDVTDLDLLVAHQANARILRAIGQQLDLDEDQVAVNLDRVGNTVAASIPLALADAVATGRLRPGHHVALAAFGGGLTWGSAVLRWPDIPVAME
ncbi:3-oxoacyl-[acyl-carrier-protein] synthase-3 [Kibdelosporangium phytohabitans]|nr:3-oxoacyl-[acyl-carrier-protein] synthase-3 [Kibdelosporangium phytohabitans]